MAKTKALISFAVTAKLICVFVFAYAKIRFSHDAAFISLWFLYRQLQASVAEQFGLCITCSEIPKTSFLVTRLDYCLYFVYLLLIIESYVCACFEGLGEDWSSQTSNLNKVIT